MTRLLETPWLYRVVRWVLAAMFLVAGIIKLSDPQVFAVTVDAFGILPRGLALPVAWLLPMIEVAAALGLALDRRGSLGVLSGLLLFFVALLAWGISMGFHIDCGCYGPGDPEARAFDGMLTSLYRDLFMLTGAAYLYWWRSRRDWRPLEIRNLMNRFFMAKGKEV